MNKAILRVKLFTKYLLSKKTEKYKSYYKKKIVIALAADYGNLGDVAITYAQKLFLQENFPEYSIIEFPISDTFTELKTLKSNIKKDDIITIVGGGNIGDMYDDIEYCRQFIIQKFPNNKIVIFPQTIDFSDTSIGRKALKRCVKKYSKHSNLFLCAREEASFEKYRDKFKNNMILTPDIVMSVQMEAARTPREGILVIFRGDKEALIDYTVKEKVVSCLKEEKITHCDTHIGQTDLKIKGLYQKMFDLWDEFRKHEIVITDRLHGMIFAYITQTPCIVIPNNNHKIASCFKWIEDAGYVRMINKQQFMDEKFMRNCIGEMRNINTMCLEKIDLSVAFEKIINVMKE